MRRTAMIATVVAAGLGATEAGCSSSCCTVDSLPIGLVAAGGGMGAGALEVPAVNEAGPFTMAFDSGSPLTFFAGTPAGTPGVVGRTFSLVDGAAGLGATHPVRGIFRGVGTLTVPLGTLADGSSPQAIFGADILSGYAVDFWFDQPAVTFWGRQGAGDDDLTAAGFAVLHTPLVGAIEVSANGPSDFLGLTGPLDVAATRVTLRTCGDPAAFDPTVAATAMCCTATDARADTTGVDMALVVATGLGPVVLGQSAWSRLAAADPSLQAPVAGPDVRTASFVASFPASWTTVPRLAFVDLSDNPAFDPGPCFELAQARRLEQVELHRADDACAAPCDLDSDDHSRVVDSAAYTEVDGNLVVAVVADTSDLLQGVRAEIRGAGPEVDGFVGAQTLRSTHLEIDYPGSPSRSIFSCAPALAGGDTCKTAPRCPGAPVAGGSQRCFGRMTVPAPMCAPSGC